VTTAAWPTGGWCIHGAAFTAACWMCGRAADVVLIAPEEDAWKLAAIRALLTRYGTDPDNPPNGTQVLAELRKLVGP